MTAVSLHLIPEVERALGERKREVPRAIAAAAVSLLERNARAEREGRLSGAEARAGAIAELRGLRYGAEGKDYVWVIDRVPRMVMHPYRPEMEGRPLADFQDAHGGRPFTEALAAVAGCGEGGVDYYWQWQDDPKRVSPKHSVVREFRPWGWVVGSGVYLDDVAAEIRGVTRRLLWIATAVGGCIALLLAGLVRVGWQSERRRREAEGELARSRERYAALAHATGETVILVLGGRVAGCNRTACELLGRSEGELLGAPVASLLADGASRSLIDAVCAGRETVETEAALASSRGPVPVLISAARAEVHGEDAIVLAARDLRPLPVAPEEEISDLLAAAGIGTARIDPAEGRWLAVDGIGAELLVPDGPAPLGAPIDRVLASAEEARTLLGALASGPVRGMLFELAPGPGGPRTIRIWAASCPGGRGRLLLLSDATVDTAARRAAEAVAADLVAGLPPAEPSSVEELAAFRLRADALARARVGAGVDPERVAAAAGEAANIILRKAADLAVARLGPPPRPVALLGAGSLGRGEPTLLADQDTMLVCADGPADPTVDAWLARFGEAVTASAAGAGLPACEAGNTAADSRWRLPLSGWRELFSRWIDEAEPENLLRSQVFFDFRPLWGEAPLAAVLRAHVRAAVTARPVFLLQLARDTLAFKPPLSLFGSIRPDDAEAGTLDLKGAMIHYVHFARLLALRHGLEETGTAERLRRLARGGHLGADAVAETLDAWRFLLSMRLRIQVGAEARGLPPVNRLDPSACSAWERESLRRALAHVERLRAILSREVGGA